MHAYEVPVLFAAKSKSEERKASLTDDTKAKKKKKKGDGPPPESVQPPPGPLVALGRPKDKAQKRPRSVVGGMSHDVSHDHAIVIVLLTSTCIECCHDIMLFCGAGCVYVCVCVGWGETQSSSCDKGMSGILYGSLLTACCWRLPRGYPPISRPF